MSEQSNIAAYQTEHHRTVNWLESMVIGLNLCPFAKKPHLNKQVHFEYLDSGKCAHIQHRLEAELRRLDDNPEIETTLIVVTKGLEDFYSYLSILDVAQELLQKLGYEGTYQVASFHPNYLFDGEAGDSPSHYTNRSPYPIIHLIREDSIEKVLSLYKEPESIPNRNIALMHELGVKKLEQLLRQ